jgi:hypothetical protein
MSNKSVQLKDLPEGAVFMFYMPDLRRRPIIDWLWQLLGCRAQELFIKGPVWPVGGTFCIFQCRQRGSDNSSGYLVAEDVAVIEVH